MINYKLHFQSDCCPDVDYNPIIPIESCDDIIELLESGWPICPECGDDLSYFKGEENEQ